MLTGGELLLFLAEMESCEEVKTSAYWLFSSNWALLQNVFLSSEFTKSACDNDSQIQNSLFLWCFSLSLLSI
jgi:hypothetical protein